MSIAEKLTTVAENVPKVYDAGKQAGLDEFWDNFQQNGQRTQYNYAFGGIGWTMDTFKPKYDIEAVNAGSMFYQTGITNLETALLNTGVRLDFSQVTNFPNTFYYGNFTLIPEVDFSGTVNTANPFSGTFMHCQYLVNIRKIILPTNGIQTFPSTFNRCDRLEHITFEGKIGQNISFAHSSKLTYKSLTSIKDHLYDYSTEGGTHTLTLHADAYARLTTDDVAQIQAKGWTIAV